MAREDKSLIDGLEKDIRATVLIRDRSGYASSAPNYLIRHAARTELKRISRDYASEPEGQRAKQILSSNSLDLIDSIREVLAVYLNL